MSDKSNKSISVDQRMIDLCMRAYKGLFASINTLPSYGPEPDSWSRQKAITDAAQYHLDGFMEFVGRLSKDAVEVQEDDAD